ncbi:META domain-containing protein [Rhizobium sp. 18065]|uniref:META domain-containing protein n=1 Tax=Rhizobium sp. 18065 TaxID=2681411 RepID=UPI00135798A7|nr:META domain-containing protein [Rhizobium sp. 18065]
MRWKLKLISICAILLGASSSVLAASDGAAKPELPLTARGNEPGWIATLDGGRISFRTVDDGTTVEGALPEPTAKGETWHYAADTIDLAVGITPVVCRDTMTGMPSPLTVTVTTGAKTFNGCGGEPVSLLAGPAWRVTRIGDAAVPEDVYVSLEFDATKTSVFGSSGCNRYFGGFTLTGEGFSFQRGMAGSMMACEEHKSQIEASFLSAMEKIDRFDIDADGGLVLISSDSPSIMATRSK